MYLYDVQTFTDLVINVALSPLQCQETSCVNSIAQKAAFEALAGDQSFRIEIKKVFKKRRDLMVSLLNSLPDIL